MEQERSFDQLCLVARQGDAHAQFLLGLMYAEGCSVKKDDTVVAAWYRKAAEQGHAHAQYNLGLMYAAGRGVEMDEDEAVSWYRKAADQGHAGALSRIMTCMKRAGL
ncbi:MAG: tetratricopeptide repeat protein [Kiritimatiellia bacterium]|nr:tetratricopeptide repeat protein [Kiritimatiellia bacterium]